eukprot:m51a1_g5273 putative myosin light chain (318) ;mRNA; r:151392-152789
MEQQPATALDLTGYRASKQRVTYTFGPRIADGSFSQVYRASATAVGAEGTPSQETLAIKVIPKSQLYNDTQVQNVKREVEIGLQVSHENVLNILDVFETAEYLFLVTAFMEGGDLYDRVMTRGAFSEADAAFLIRQVCAGAAYLHSLSICHRDIKPENLLCTEAEGEGDTRVRLADFGLSRHFTDLMHTRCGSPLYLAPEVIMGSPYSITCDTWSIGVVAYVLLVGQTPFDNLTQIVTGPYPEEPLVHVSPVAREFLAAALDKNPASRPSAAQLLEHQWLSDQFQGVAAGTSLRDSVLRLSQNIDACRGGKREGGSA